MTAQEKHTILIIEDEPLMVKILKAFLESAEFNVLTARDGLEGVAIYEQNKAQIELILSDITLPEMDGWAVYARLRAINPEVKVIFTSGFFDPELKAQCERAGIQDLIPKPFRLDEVVNIVRSKVSPGSPT
jgi:two-component system, cell cycle sensor histidine kinase and response regulator CckA